MSNKGLALHILKEHWPGLPQSSMTLKDIANHKNIVLNHNGDHINGCNYYHQWGHPMKHSHPGIKNHPRWDLFN